MRRNGDILYDLLDSQTGQYDTYEKVTALPDGTPIDDTNVLPLIPIYRKSGSEYFRKTSINTRFLSAREFGAIGDGVANDGAAIQAALDCMHQLGGGTVFLPSGTYATSWTLQIGNRTTLLGDINTVITDWGPDPSSLKIGTSNMPTADLFYTDVHVKNIKLNHLYGSNSIGLCRVDGGSVNNCSSTTLNSHLTDIYACRNIVVSECMAQGSAAEVYQCDGSTSVGGLPYRTPDGVVHQPPADGYSCKNITFRNCVSINNHGAFHLHRGTGVPHENITIENNYIEWDLLDATDVTGVKSDADTGLWNIKVRGNEFRNCPTPLNIRGSFVGISIANNKFKCDEGKEQGRLFFSFGSFEYNRQDLTFTNNWVERYKVPLSFRRIKGGNFLNNFFTFCSQPFDGTPLDFTNINTRSNYVFDINDTCDGILIKNNYFDNCPYGIVRENVTVVSNNITISDNVLVDSGDLLISIGTANPINGEGIKIMGNTLNLSPYMFLVVEINRKTGVLITGNRIEANTGKIINIRNSTNLRIWDNELITANMTGSPVGIDILDTNGIEINEHNFVDNIIGTNYIRVQTSTGTIRSNLTTVPNIIGAATIEYHGVSSGTTPVITNVLQGSTFRNNDLTVAIKDWVFNGTNWAAVAVGLSQAAPQVDSAAPDLDTLKNDFNGLLAKLRAAGLLDT